MGRERERRRTGEGRGYRQHGEGKEGGMARRWGRIVEGGRGVGIGKSAFGGPGSHCFLHIRIVYFTY